MPNAPLDGCWAKIKRADENTNNLATEIERFIKTNLGSYRVVTELNAETKECVLKAVGQGPRIDPRISVLVGEIVYHLRSSLDHLMWGLVTKKHAAPDWKPQFPICYKASDFEATRNGIAKGITSKARALIEAVQPYHRTPPESHPLAILQTLNNTDKHSLLLVVSGILWQPTYVQLTVKGKGTGQVLARPCSFSLPNTAQNS